MDGVTHYEPRPCGCFEAQNSDREPDTIHTECVRCETTIAIKAPKTEAGKPTICTACAAITLAMLDRGQPL